MQAQKSTPNLGYMSTIFVDYYYKKYKIYNQNVSQLLNSDIRIQQ